jgi:tetratricopeptide (TPR) repeat protein
VGRAGTASALKCAAFWRERQARLDALKDPWEQGEAILAQWRLFVPFAERLGDVPERCLFSLKQRAFTTALALYRRVLEAGAGEDPELLSRIGRCAKGMGTYDLAIEFLERANRERREDAAILAELADAYSLAGEEREAKVFFREAFFIDPQAVDLGLLESPLVGRLAARLRAMGYAEPELAEWVPVYGAIYGVFSVRRELKPLELGRLKQAVFQLEKEVRREASPRVLVPRLINRYFWLIDHYRTVGESRERVEEVLTRVRELDPRVHRDYTT